MKTITYDDFISFRPCWLETEEGRRKLKYYAGMRKEWTALNILTLTCIDALDKFWTVLRPELLSDHVLNEFSCLCAEKALNAVGGYKYESVNGVEKKRAHMRGEISNDELSAANYPTFRATHIAYAHYAALTAVCVTVCTKVDAYEAAKSCLIALNHIATANNNVAVVDDVLSNQLIDMLMKLIEEEEKKETPEGA